MIVQQDWILRQIEIMVNMLERLLLRQDTATMEQLEFGGETETDTLYSALLQLLSAGRINEAENLLFERLNTADIGQLRLALDFYRRVNELDDKTLEEADFSREEIQSGLADVLQAFGVSMEGLL